MFHADLAAIGPFGRDLILLSVQDVRALFRAVAESEAVGLEPEELEDAKRALEREAASAAQDFEERILERKAQLLLPAAELTFEKAWFTKKSDILDELCHNLRSCSMSSTGRVCKVEALDRRVLLKLGLELKSQLGHESSTSWASSPIVMVAMLLYTQQDVDTDRSMLFPDCPSSAVGQRLFREKKEAYDAYRTRVASGLATRNPMLFTEVSHVAAAVLQSALQGMQDGSRSAEPLQKWVKTACLLSSCLWLCILTEGSMMSSRLRSACLSDLTMASYELVQGLEELPTPSPLSLSLEQSKLDRSNIFEPNQYNSKVFQSLVHAFEALDRRGAWMISLSDYSWAQDMLGIQQHTGCILPTKM
eukprot:g22553.t1